MDMKPHKPNQDDWWAEADAVGSWHPDRKAPKGEWYLEGREEALRQEPFRRQALKNSFKNRGSDSREADKADFDGSSTPRPFCGGDNPTAEFLVDKEYHGSHAQFPECFDFGGTSSSKGVDGKGCQLLEELPESDTRLLERRLLQRWQYHCGAFLRLLVDERKNSLFFGCNRMANVSAAYQLWYPLVRLTVLPPRLIEEIFPWGGQRP